MESKYVVVWLDIASFQKHDAKKYFVNVTSNENNITLYIDLM